MAGSGTLPLVPGTLLPTFAAPVLPAHRGPALDFSLWWAERTILSGFL